MILLGVQMFGWEIDTALFIFIATCMGMFSWWLILMYMNLHEIKTASQHRGKQLDLVIIKVNALGKTLGTDGIEIGKTFKDEYEKNVKQAMEEYKIEAI